MDVMCENREYRDYFEDVQGFYREQEKPEEVIPIARRIKDLRARHNLSLEQFSWIADIDVDRLAAIEERRVLPDVAAIVKISRALRIETGCLLGERSGSGYTVVRGKDRMNIVRHAAGAAERPNYHYQSLASGVAGRKMEIFLLTLTAEAGSDELSVHSGEEFLLVTGGAVRVILGDREEILEEGDSIYYRAAIPHNVTNLSRQDKAVIMAVIYPGR